MARQTSVFTLKGTIKGINFYTRKGKSYARSITSLNKQRIENDPAFLRTIENAKEFGGCKKVVKSVRLGLIEFIKTMSDYNTFNRLTGFIKQINMKGLGDRGKRLINMQEYGYLLDGFEFISDSSFNSVFRGSFELEQSVGKDSSLLKFILLFLKSC